MNMYTTKELREVINWLGHDRLLPFLDAKGIQPAHEISTAKRKYRLYDEAALIKCRELRAERDKATEQKKPQAPVKDVSHDALIAAMAQDIAHIRKQLDLLTKELGSASPAFDDEGVGGTD
jgi:hypothetical protein